MHRSRRLISQHEVSPKLNVPFSWEFSPGIPKLTSQLGCSGGEDWNGHFTLSSFPLPPPPCPSDHHHISSSARFDYIVEEDSIDKQLNSLPLCSVIQMSPTVASLSILGNGGARKDTESDDPFLAAFVNCTRSPFSFDKKFTKSKGKKYGRCAMIKKTIFTLSCIYSCNVTKDNAVGTPQLSPKKSSSLR